MSSFKKFLYLNVNINENNEDILDFTKEQHEKLKKRIAVDFDGVIHSYHKGWQNGEIYGYPIEGAKETLKKLKDEGYEIIIHTARICNFDGNIAPNRLKKLTEWLDVNKIPYDSIEPKIAAMFYIDDRAINCNPLKEKEKNWNYVLEKIFDRKNLDN